MNHKNIIYQTQISSGVGQIPKICFGIAAAAIVAAFIVASSVAPSRYTAIEWMFRYIELYIWFFIGAAIFVAIGFALNSQEPGSFTITDLYVCLDSAKNTIVLPMEKITSIRKVNNTLIISAATGAIHLNNITMPHDIINALLGQMAKTNSEVE